jgi:WD40 repeat protein
MELFSLPPPGSSDSVTIRRLNDRPIADAFIMTGEHDWIFYLDDKTYRYRRLLGSQKLSEAQSIKGLPSDAWIAGWSPDGRWIVVDSKSAGSSLWLMEDDDILQVKSLLPLDDHSICLFSPDGKKLALSHANGGVMLYRCQGNASWNDPCELAPKYENIVDIQFSGDSRWLFARCHTRAFLAHTSLASPSVSLTPLCPLQNFGGAAISATSRWLVLLESGVIKLWDLRDPIIQKPLEVSDPNKAYTSFSISSKGRWLTACDENEDLRIWDLDAGDILSSKSLVSHHAQWVLFDYDDRYLVSGHYRAGVRFWNMDQDGPTGDARMLSLPNANIVAHAFLPGSPARLITRSSDWLHLQIWTLDIRALLEVTEELLSRNLSLDEWNEYFFEESWRRIFESLPP